MSIKKRKLERLTALFERSGRKASIPNILLNNADRRSGISKLRVKSKVLRRESEIFQYDTPHTKMIEVIIEEIMNELIENSFIEITIPPNGLLTLSEGSNGAGPVISTGRNITFANGKGIIR